MRIVLFVVVTAAVVVVAWSLRPLLWENHPAWQADEASTISLLKSTIFPAQITYQAHPVRDADGDKVGEFGLLSELAGRRSGSLPNGTSPFLSGPLAGGDLARNYRFAVWLPDGSGGALGEPSDLAARPAGADAAVQAQERHFRAYAWPADAAAATDGSRRMFCLAEDGVARTQPWTGAVPGWDAVTGGKGWDAPAVWPAFKR